LPGHLKALCLAQAAEQGQGPQIVRAKPMLALAGKTISNILIAIGATILALMMFLTALDVGLRYLFNSPLSGAFELVEYMMAIVIPFSIVYCAEMKAHVSVELILARFPKKFQLIVNALTTLIAVAFTGVMAWQNLLYIGEVYDSHLTSSVLLIPTYPFVIPVALGIGAFALMLLIHFIEIASRMVKP
jgi:TRAP-type transport system small permease protein